MSDMDAAKAVAEAREVVAELAATGKTEAELIVAEAEALAMCLMSLSKLPAAHRKSVVEYLHERFAKISYLGMLTLVLDESDERIREANNAKMSVEIENARLRKALDKSAASSVGADS